MIKLIINLYFHVRRKEENVRLHPNDFAEISKRLDEFVTVYNTMLLNWAGTTQNVQNRIIERMSETQAQLAVR